MDKKTDDLLKKAKDKEEPMKAYAMLIKVKDGQFLWLEAAYTLETAFSQAKTHLSKIHRDVSFREAKIELFNHETLQELFERTGELDIFKKPFTTANTSTSPNLVDFGVISDKKTREAEVSALMKVIIETRNLEMLNQNRDVFNDAQMKFLEEKLKIKK